MGRSKFLNQTLLTLGKVWAWIWVLVWQSYQIACVFKTSKASPAKPVTPNCDLVRPCVMTGSRARTSLSTLLKALLHRYIDFFPDIICNIVKDLERKEGCNSYQSWSIFQVSDVTGEKLIYTAVSAAKQICHFSTQITNFSSLYFPSRIYILKYEIKQLLSWILWALKWDLPWLYCKLLGAELTYKFSPLINWLL